MEDMARLLFENLCGVMAITCANHYFFSIAPSTMSSLFFTTSRMLHHRNDNCTLKRTLVLLLFTTMGFSTAFIPPMDASRHTQTFDAKSIADTSMMLSELARHAGIQASIRISHKSDTSPLYLFGNMFGSDVDSTRENKELARIENLGSTEQKYDSLAEYVQQWSKFFESDPKGMGLVTPVNLLPSDTTAAEDKVAKVSGVKIVFKKTKTGGSYKSSKEEKAVEEGGTTVKKKKVIREGGVEILVEQLSDGKVQLRARRCETDEETTIKEMSEEAIVNDLKKAVGVWKKQQ